MGGGVGCCTGGEVAIIRRRRLQHRQKSISCSLSLQDGSRGATRGRTGGGASNAVAMGRGKARAQEITWATSAGGR